MGANRCFAFDCLIGTARFLIVKTQSVKCNAV